VNDPRLPVILRESKKTKKIEKSERLRKKFFSMGLKNRKAKQKKHFS